MSTRWDRIEAVASIPAGAGEVWWVTYAGRCAYAGNPLAVYRIEIRPWWSAMRLIWWVFDRRRVGYVVRQVIRGRW